MPTTGFLLWNLRERSLNPSLLRLSHQHCADVVILVEPPTDGLNPFVYLGGFSLVSEPNSPITILSRLPNTRFQTVLTSGRWQILTVQRTGLPELLLVAAHLPSKREANELDQLNAAIGLSQDIRDAEGVHGHTRTVVVGDLNMNPFESGVSMNRGLHATSTRAVAAWESRAVQRVEYPLFYNPMWSCFGDRSPGPAGTYYRAASHAVHYHWNIYDQVLLRPAVMEALEEVLILDHDGEQSLLTATGIPDTSVGSDHLPVYFRLNWDAIRS